MTWNVLGVEILMYAFLRNVNNLFLLRRTDNRANIANNRKIMIDNSRISSN